MINSNYFHIQILNKLNINPGNKSPSAWEIPSQRIMLTYKIGDGQFGYVYGGHVRVSKNKTTINVPVAAKSLKPGSNNDERIDFLCEAETMKQLNHPNIVKLMGVSLDGMTTFVIMEYMNQGDLRSYLLKMRHLVDEVTTTWTEDDFEVSPKRLTKMVLDISKGLSYLAQNKFVHRDIACRNCLVNKERNGEFVVKLADFGLTRNIFENENYQRRRNICLPMLWSAPESLKLRIYTPASDVWSFGIVVWEIITFGAAPYPGMTIPEATNHILQGRSMDIPSAASRSLAWLMKQCWNVDYRERIGASEIVNYLTNNPRLITPCLDGCLHINITDGYSMGCAQIDKRLKNNESWQYVQPNESLSHSEYIDMMEVINSKSPLMEDNKIEDDVERKSWTKKCVTFLVKLFNPSISTVPEMTRL